MSSMSSAPQSPVSAEQMQLQNIQGSLKCVSTCMDLVREKTINLSNVDSLNQTLNWLTSIDMNLRNEHQELLKRIPKAPPPLVSVPQAPPVNVAPMDAPIKRGPGRPKK